MTIEILTDHQLTGLRRDLATARFTHHQRAAAYCNALANNTATQAEADAHQGAVMAATYAYVLAAVLGEIARDEDDGDLAFATRLAQLAKDLLDNGDLDGWNDDVLPDGGSPGAHALHAAAAAACTAEVSDHTCTCLTGEPTA